MSRIQKTRAAKAPVKKLSNDEVRAWLQTAKSSLDPEHILQKTAQILAKGGPTYDITNEEESKTLSDALLLTGHERHYLVAESVTDERWRPMIMDLAGTIQKEYDCVNNSEIALAGLAASAYYRSLRMARKLDGLVFSDGLGIIAITLASYLSKEIDRADRQYLAAIQTLHERRQPQMNIRVQTKTAFFGNQTINTENSTKSYEANDTQ